MNSSAQREAFVTLATTDTYALGALALAESLKRVGTKKELAVMISPSTISPHMQILLSDVFDWVEEVDPLNSNDEINLGLLTRPELGITFTKFHVWRLTRYSKAVFMDADCLVLQNIDDIFAYEEFSASPDPGWPDCFNSGVFVLRPSLETYSKILQFSLTTGSFDGGDQGLLNEYFSSWAHTDIRKHLPFVYNCVSQAFYSYLPAMKRFGRDIRVVHFIGPVKPWEHTADPVTGKVLMIEGTGFSERFLQFWWNIFLAYVHPKLSDTMITTLPPASVEGNRAVAEQITVPELQQLSAIDYSGNDRVDKDRNEILPQLSIQHPFDFDLHATYTTTAVHVVRYLITVEIYSDGELEKQDAVVTQLSYLTPEEFVDALVKEELLSAVDAPQELKRYRSGAFGKKPLGRQDGIAGRLAKLQLSAKVKCQTPPSYETEWGNVTDSGCGATSHTVDVSASDNGETHRERQYRWERGEIDYLGEDRFDNILNKINKEIFHKES